MVGYLLLVVFLISGIVTMDGLLKQKCALVRIWTGLSCGMMMMMLLPAAFAFAMKFSQTAQLCAAAASIVIALGVRIATHKKKYGESAFAGDMPRWMPHVLVLPLLLLSVYLLYTHYLRPVNGELHVGQSTYGDLSLHLGIASSLRNAAFPPDYSILKGTLLGYPFLGDSMVTSMLLFGAGLSASFIVTGTVMFLIVYVGFLLLAWELTKNRIATVLAFVLLFLNGGLGFLYIFDGIIHDPTPIYELFHGFYKTPTNMTDLNVRWVNLICDMFIPQRTFLTGWMTLLPALYLFVNAVQSRKRSSFLLLGVWAGMMPMIHTHSFFALGLMSAGAMVYSLIHAGKDFKETLICYLCYGITAVLIAAPQLLTWTFPQTVGGGSLNLRPNWVNNQGNGTLIDSYFWFWIKNVGLVYILIVPAVLSQKKGSLLRTMAVGALVIYTIAELIQFQPNPYDNNKLFYAAYMMVLPSVGLYLVQLWEALKSVRGRAFLAAVFMGVCTVSGVLTIAREVVSDYGLFNASEVEAAAFIEENTDEHCMILTGTQHCNAVAALTGRYILCGTSSYLYYHGVDFSAQQSAVSLLFTDPEANRALFEEYGIDYIYISSWERSSYEVNSAWYDTNCELIYENADVKLYKY